MRPHSSLTVCDFWWTVLRSFGWSCHTIWEYPRFRFCEQIFTPIIVLKLFTQTQLHRKSQRKTSEMFSRFMRKSNCTHGYFHFDHQDCSVTTVIGWPTKEWLRSLEKYSFLWTWNDIDCFAAQAQEHCGVQGLSVRKRFLQNNHGTGEWH